MAVILFINWSVMKSDVMETNVSSDDVASDVIALMLFKSKSDKVNTMTVSLSLAIMSENPVSVCSY